MATPMVGPSVENIRERATAVVVMLQREFVEQNIVGSIIGQYTAFCKTDDARRLSIAQQPITNELKLRLHFECLSFCSFCCSLLSDKYITERKWFSRRPNQQRIGLFDGALIATVMEECARLGIDNFREIALVAIDPELTWGDGGNIDPLNRLEEYRSAFVKQRGSEMEHFGKWIGKTLDAPHYPLFETIGMAYSTPLLHLTTHVMETVFLREG